MKIVILDGATVNPGDLTWEEVSALGDIRIYGRTPQEKVIEIIGDADVVFSSKVKITRQVMDA